MVTAIRRTGLLLLVLGFCACIQAQSDEVAAARANLKKWGIAYSIHLALPATKADSLAAYSQAAYFEAGSHREKAYAAIKKFVQQYLASGVEPGMQGADLRLKKCLDLVTDKNYEKKIILCDKWIIRK
ncbi:hypothetical protein GCM10027051_29880 [Niabella terrae]